MFNKERFRNLFEVYYPMLCRIAFGYIENADECEDIVQECFIAVWENGKYELADKEFLAYMVRAVKNNCISFIRKQNQNIMPIDDCPLHSVCAEMMEEEKENLSPDEKLEKILSILPPRCKEVFILSKIHGMKYQEIATMLGLSVKTVENHMGKALKLIREHIKTGFLILALILFFHS